MFNLNNSHQFCKVYDDDDILVCHWVMDKVSRSDRDVWIIEHFFFNPAAEQAFFINEMHNIFEIATTTATPVWPLDPQIIAYFKQHPKFAKIWYHKPDSI
ncbi:hypothetical protein [Lactobacillus sp. ESL0230]|uniref:hypothetical protein n=1 Tax=Lactobacillus sp. ESL0230 TaxID=2069353 RepID=UPI000EFDA5A9|nr:hypothetical protein [Lactobacillus sp. ESL0230]RMC45243.1 hypothetical protein F5ESL0230_06480 [Lactobacillus sp. ESL0230]